MRVSIILIGLGLFIGIVLFATPAMADCVGGVPNGVVEGPEECDDGNLNNVDACSNSCTANVCGNGRTDPPENCDDGTGTNASPVPASSILCDADCTDQACGDGFVNSTFGVFSRPQGEECDDGNTADGDGCSSICQIEPDAPGIETCDLTATTSPIVSLPADRTFTVSTFTCTDKAPATMFGIPCSGFEDADNTLGGTFDVHFEQSLTDPNEIDLTVDISNITMTPFTLCGFLIDVTNHELNDQDLSYNPITGVLGGSTTSDVYVTVDNVFTATAAKLGTYTGSLDSSTGNLSFSYAGTWRIESPVPGLTPFATVILVVLLVGGAGFVLWRRRVAGA